MIPDGTQAVILAGGRGNRLGPLLGDLNKPMLDVAGRPFLDLLVMQLQRHRIHDLVFCTGYRGELVERHFGDGTRWGVSIRYSREASPLGTAGALKLADPLIESDPFVVLNGDSILDLDPGALVARHRESGALLTLALVRLSDVGRYGAVETDAAGTVVRFREKAQGGEGLVNAGVYACSRELLEHLPAGRAASLESEILPSLPAGRVHGVAVDGYFVDIGVPETLRRVQADPAPLLAAAGALAPC